MKRRLMGVEKAFWVFTCIGFGLWFLLFGAWCAGYGVDADSGRVTYSSGVVVVVGIVHALLLWVPWYVVGLPIAAVSCYMKNQTEKAKAWREYYQKYAEWQEQVRLQGRA